jgi:2'-5' RNA ligase
MRLFFGLALPDSLRERLSHLRFGVEGAKWSEPSNYHITLRFLGEIEEPLIDPLCEAAAEAGRGALTLSLSGVGHFKTGREPRVLWAGIGEGVEPLSALAARLERAAQGQGLEPDHRNYAPHVTLARMKSARLRHVETWLAEHADFVSTPFTARRFHLYESRPGKSGPAYVPLVDFPLED